jgi:hypothetical protein
VLAGVLTISPFGSAVPCTTLTGLESLARTLQLQVRRIVLRAIAQRTRCRRSTHRSWLQIREATATSRNRGSYPTSTASNSVIDERALTDCGICWTTAASGGSGTRGIGSKWEMSERLHDPGWHATLAGQGHAAWALRFGPPRGSRILRLRRTQRVQNVYQYSLSAGMHRTRTRRFRAHTDRADNPSSCIV